MAPLVNRAILALTLVAGTLAPAAPARADRTDIAVRMVTADGLGASIGSIMAVDSWFTTLATLVFDITGLAPGTYHVWLHQAADCGAAPVDGVMLAGHAAGPVYDRVDRQSAAPLGMLGDITVDPDGTVTRTISIKPDKLVDGAEKLTVLEMRGHALVIHRTRGGPDSRIACGTVPVSGPAD